MVSAAMPTARLATPIRVRPGVRATLSSASEVIPRGWCARRTASTGGRTELTGSARAASQAGARPATTATAIATGTASSARPGEARRPSPADTGTAMAAASSPAASPIPASSPSTVANSRDRRQPTAASTPSSRRRPRTAAVAALPTNSTHTTRISVNSATLVLSTAFRIATATPFFTQFSDRVSGGWPEPARGQVDGHRRRRGAGHDVHIQAGALGDLLRDRVDPLPRQRIRPGDARDPDPDHADRISGGHAGVDQAVLQLRQRRQGGDQVHRLADQAAQVLAGQQVAPVQRPAAGRGRRRRGHRLVVAQRHPRQRGKRPDPGRVEDTGDLDQGGRQVCAFDVTCEVTVRYWLFSSSMATEARLPVSQTDGRLTT